MSEAMNAPNPVPSPAGTGDARPYEPSMEEILASIRRIIADDQSLPGRTKTDEPSPEGGASASLHVLRSEGSSDPEPLVETQARSEPVVAAAPKPDIGIDSAEETIVAPQDLSPETLSNGPVEPEPAMPLPTTQDPAPALSDRLEAIHHQTHGEPAKQEIATLLGGSENYFDPPDEHDRPGALAAKAAPLFSATTNSSVTSAFNVLAASRLADNSDELLGMAREMIKPLLRSWLDENLPSMVERMVRDEIERVARGGH